MKTNIFLVGLVLLCAVSGYNSQPIQEDELIVFNNLGLNEVLEALKKIAVNLAKEIKRAVDEPHADFTTKVDNVLGALLESGEEALRELQNMNEELMQEKIESLPEGQQKQCLEKLQPTSKAISAEYITNLRECGESARTSIVQSVRKVANITEEVKKIGTDLIEAIITCADSNNGNIQDAVTCAANETLAGRKALGKLMGHLSATLAKESVALARTAMNAKHCTRNVLKEATDKLRHAIKGIDECNNHNLLN